MFAKILLFCLLGAAYFTSIAKGYPRPQHPITTINIYTKPHMHPNSMPESNSPQYEVACLSDGTCTSGTVCRNGVCAKSKITRKNNQQDYRKVASSKKEDVIPVGPNDNGHLQKKPITKNGPQPMNENSPQLEGEIIHTMPANYEPVRRSNDDSSMMSPEEDDEEDYEQAMHHYKHDDMGIPAMDERENDVEMNSVMGNYRNGDMQHMDNYQYQHHAADQYQDDMAWDHIPA
ncbi:hypothetical protein CBL_04392 [Carabus blaptoides fortunei]